MKEEKCKYCDDSEEGELLYDFEEGDHKEHLFVCNKEGAIIARVWGKELSLEMYREVNYCPMCGEPLGRR